MPILEHTGRESSPDRYDGLETHDCGHDYTAHDQTRHSVASGLDDHLKYERYRRSTFDSWPSWQNVNKDDLARNGFHYIGNGTDDRVQCVFCKIILYSWDRDDIIEEEHKKHAPRCPFVTDPSHVDNFPISFRPIQSINVHHRGPLHVEYESREIRLASFNSWPSNKQQTPGELANAGFFYLGEGDSVKCYYCGGMLRHWEETDDVWTEHRKWFPLCKFVVEHDPATHPDLPHHLRRTISGIALANGYSEEAIQNFRSYIEDNEMIHPDEYREFVNQLDQFLESLPEYTGTIQGQKQFSSNNSMPEQQQATNKEITPSQVSDSYTCKVCLDNPVEMIFYPCKHVCCCLKCSDTLFESNPNATCPICRTKITGKLQLFFS